jgi:hypothetical protein
MVQGTLSTFKNTQKGMERESLQKRKKKKKKQLKKAK